MAKPSADSVAHHRVADGSTDDQTEPRSPRARPVLVKGYVNDDEPPPPLDTLTDHRVEIPGAVETVGFGQHRYERRRATTDSGRQRRAALAAARRDGGAASPGPHTQAKAVHLGTTAVVRLEGPLALCHSRLLMCLRRRFPTHGMDQITSGPGVQRPSRRAVTA